MGGGGGRLGVVRVDVNEELRFWENSQKNIRGGGVGRGGGQVGGRVGGGVRVDVNAMLGVMWGMGDVNQE